ncbi:MAG: anthranilate phosphoribosyltransferase [Candidatus Eremiobacteraeota bacterium]|nr:anthranilate phosphoribosyltransferase [Candidatus Eremiobacteraeota bacterium]
MTIAAPPFHLTELIRRCAGGRHLEADEAETAFGMILDGAATQAQTAALLAILARNGESAAELAGAVRAVRARAGTVQSARRPLLDVCGTGGDHSHSFNISTATALVVAGAGVAVAKHGNRAMTSRSGSADVLEAAGVDLQRSAATAEASLASAGVAFLYAQAFHPALQAVAPVRREIGIRTLFNLIGPLCNPAELTHQIVGVPERRSMQTMLAVLAMLGRTRAAVLCAADGMDEVSVTTATHVMEWTGSRVLEYEIAPEMIGLPRYAPGAVAGGGPQENLAILRRLLDGWDGAHRDIVVLNAALALQIAGAAPDLSGAAELAQSSIDGGGAARALAALIAASC